MSGRDHEPVAAFFPSIDRNLILDLDRHLRSANAASPAGPTSGPPNFREPAPHVQAPGSAAVSSGVPSLGVGRPNIASVVEAVEQAAQSMAAMTTRIEELESHIDTLEATNRHLEGQLGEADQALQLAETKLRTEADRVSRLEGVAAHQTARAIDLERELSSVHADLARVTEAIAAALGLPEDDVK